jgi:antitoxin (DNA-binding transcriptional repressor) of toxin-antitoxin stability system
LGGYATHVVRGADHWVKVPNGLDEVKAVSLILNYEGPSGQKGLVICIFKDMKTRRKELNASEFKARCLKILDQLEPSGITILKRGKPVARVIPLPDRTPKQLIGSMRERSKIKGDILKTGVRWDAPRLL